MRRRKSKRGLMIGGIAAGILIAAVIVTGIFWFRRGGEAEKERTPEELLMEYTDYIRTGNYEAMYGMLNEQSRKNIGLEDFTARNKNIYEGIGAADIRVEIQSVEERTEGLKTVSYQTSLNSSAGEINFLNQVDFIWEQAAENQGAKKKKAAGDYRMIWNDQVIFPNLGRTDKVRVSTDRSVRGEVLDRDGGLLAGKGNASLVGLVPGKMAGYTAGTEGETSGTSPDLERLSELLGVSVESIEKKLAAKWVKEDSLVPVKTLKKVDEFDLQSASPREDNVENKALQDALLAIPGVMITDTPVRSYPLGEAAAHLVGYVQNVTAEDLEKHPGEGYLSDSVIGRSGIETLYEKELKGQNGEKISIVTSEGAEKLVLAAIPRVDGSNITLTIDSSLQRTIYERFKDVKSCTVAMNPYTGEVLALVNTPSYDDNDFILGMSEEKWASLNEDERKPMFNRFRQRFAPGSSFKPITGVIGLSTGALTPGESFGTDRAGLSWQKDASWGKYQVTTLHDYSPVNLENAYIYSDNIYFAKAALKIGYDDFMAGLDRLGFNQDLPFEISVSQSQYSNTERIETEIQLADSGYGQGQVLMNPIHLAALYTMFPNRGDVIKPYITYRKEPASEVWLKGACTPEIAETIDTALKKVISSEHGTGHAAMRVDITLAGKTGTAEIKASKGDTSGTELGWFAVYTADGPDRTPILMVSMVEDVKNAGGSGLVVRKAKAVLDSYIPPVQ